MGGYQEFIDYFASISMKFLTSILACTVLAAAQFIIAPKANAGCGWGDITCNPSNWTCPPGGCGQTRPPESHIPTQIPPSTCTIWVQNNSGQTADYIYLSPTSNGNWGRDLLGNQYLGAGYRWNINNVQTNTYYDFKAVMRDGTSRTLYGFNACYMGGVNILQYP